ncbi:MAG: phage holin family protein [Candidatus Abyssobacteria bacterium SURF_5]|uniref:Phage holin family protein n=1 Tax=Abyssobacteria bacterium (strain SURF_5) TaxID=2093360 RepID=A0A3A4NTX6_ABYX5|nr:MAG: phage holin family protein [Candidatus Abyssubacteria bacterium SURF_5]
MLGFVGRFLINLLLLAFVAWLFPGIEIAGILALLFAGIVFGLLNSFVRPLLILITLPISIVTIGLFVFVINGFLFWLTARVVIGFSVSSIWTAIGGAFIYSISSLVVSLFLSDTGRIEIIQFRK